VPSDEEVTPPKRSLGAGVCGFAVDPDLRADRASPIWLPHLDSVLVLIAPAPQEFRSASRLRVTASFERRTSEGTFVVFGQGLDRLPAMFVGSAGAATPIAALVPLDADFAVRTDAALRFWRLVSGRPQAASMLLTVQRRRRLVLTLRALDGRLAGETYRGIAQGLFGSTRIPATGAWKTHDLRDRTIRLVRAGVGLMRGGYLNLLRFPARYRE
jgi:hypothetical protein